MAPGFARPRDVARDRLADAVSAFLVARFRREIDEFRRDLASDLEGVAVVRAHGGLALAELGIGDAPAQDVDLELLRLRAVDCTVACRDSGDVAVAALRRRLARLARAVSGVVLAEPRAFLAALRESLRGAVGPGVGRVALLDTGNVVVDDARRQATLNPRRPRECPGPLLRMAPGIAPDVETPAGRCFVLRETYNASLSFDVPGPCGAVFSTRAHLARLALRCAVGGDPVAANFVDVSIPQAGDDVYGGRPRLSPRIGSRPTVPGLAADAARYIAYLDSLDGDAETLAFARRKAERLRRRVATLLAVWDRTGDGRRVEDAVPWLRRGTKKHRAIAQILCGGLCPPHPPVTRSRSSV